MHYTVILIIGTLITIGAVFLVDYRYGVFTCHGTIGNLLQKMSKLGARVVTGFFYLPLGIILGKSSKYEKKLPLWILICIGLMFVIISPGYGFIYETGRALATVGIVYTLINIKLKPAAIYLIFRKLSSEIYYLYLWVYTVLCFVIYGVGNLYKGVEMYVGTLAIIIGIVGFKTLFQNGKMASIFRE